MSASRPRAKPLGRTWSAALGRRAAALAPTLVVGAALVAGYVYPPLSVMLVWPLLFFLPGWAIVRALRARLTVPSRLGVAIVISVAIAAHLVYWLATVAGAYSRETIFAAAALLALPVVWGYPAGRTPFAIRVGRSWRIARRHATPLVLAAAAGGWVALILAAGIWHVTPQGVSSGGSNWSDLLVHVSIAESVNAGNFPPQVPFFAGAPLTYHWFSDFHAGIAARAAGLFSVPVMVFSNAVFAAALALVVHALAMRLLRDRRAAVLAVVLTVMGGGLGYIRFFGDLAAGLGDPVALVTRIGYDNQWLTDWPYFRIPSVMGTGLLAHRATTAGLPMLIAIVLLVSMGLPERHRAATGWRDRPMLLVIAGLLTGLLAPFHFFFFPAALLLVGFYAAAARRLSDRAARRNAAAYLGPCAIAIPFVILPLATAGAAGTIRFHPWWDAPVEGGAAGVAFFYVTNLGVPFLLAVVAAARPSTPRRGFLAAWAALLFAIPNLVAFSSVTFDMNKYFQAMAIALALLAGWLMRRWRPLPVTLAMAASLFSPVLVSLHYAIDRPQILTTADLHAAEWARASTPERSVFVTDGWLHSFTDVAGRLRLLTFTPYIANLGYEPRLREMQVHDIYCAGADAAAALVQELGADYVVDGGPPADCPAPTDFSTDAAFALVYENAQFRIWRVVARPS
ncbi:MAG: hypothetical protein ABR509_05075 [Candidatus Limnocylindria bacterium]